MKDLSDDVTRKLTEMLQADEAALEKFYQFFGLKMEGRFPLEEIKQMFPDTAVSVLKECFEVLRLYDLVEIMEKVKPRSLRPAASPEQIEKLRRTDDRPTKYHSNVAVLVVNHIVEEDSVKREEAEKIETFFKDLNSQNEVATIALTSTQETREVLRALKRKTLEMRYYYLREEDSWKKNLESSLQRKARLEKRFEEVMLMDSGKGRHLRQSLELQLKEIKQLELRCRAQLKNFAKEKEQTERDFEKLKELEKESMIPISAALDEWIHSQGLLTSFTNTHVYSNRFERGVLIKLS